MDSASQPATNSEPTPVQEPNWPDVNEIADDLLILRTDLARYVDDPEGEGLEVRLQVYPDGRWAIRFGDSGYDTDHLGYWGNGAVCLGDSANVLGEVARDLLEQAQMQFDTEWTGDIQERATGAEE